MDVPKFCDLICTNGVDLMNCWKLCPGTELIHI